MGATACAVAALSAAAPGAPAATDPVLEQLVVFSDGSARQGFVNAARTRVRIGRRRCTVGRGTALAGLAASGVERLRIRDYGSCSRDPDDAGGLYVRSIGGDAERGRSGWVYKVGDRVATAGAADPSGPFGRGRIRTGTRVTWFFCRLSARTGRCQRTLRIAELARNGATVRIVVRSYDDRGRSRPAAGASVRAGDASAVTGADGSTTLTLAAGRHELHAEAPGLVRSFAEEVVVE